MALLRKTGWTYGTEQEQKWLDKEMGHEGVPIKGRENKKLGLNKYIALRAIQVWCAMSPADRNPIGLYRRMEVAMAMLLPAYYVLLRWINNGVEVEGRPELARNWWELGAEADRGEYDPARGGFGKTVLDLMRSDFVKDKLVEVIENLLDDSEFIKQLVKEPKTLLDLADRVLAFEKLNLAKTGAGEMTAEGFKQMLGDLMKNSPESVGQMLGKHGRKKLKKAMDRWDDE